MTDLDRISREGGADFVLDLENAAPLACAEIVRRLPGRRLVCRGSWQGREVYAKLFIGETARRYAERDARGATALAAGGLLTPELLHEGNIDGQAGRTLIYAAISDARNVEELLQQSDAEQRAALADALVRTVALQHAAGLVQTDLYPRNFLHSPAGIHSLDGDGIRIFPKPIGARRALSNLALLVSKFPVEDAARIPEWLRIYGATRGWEDGRIRAETLVSIAASIRSRLARHYSRRKVLRNCSEVRVEQAFGRYVAVARARLDDNLARVIADPDRFLDGPQCRILKDGNTCTVGLVNAGARNIVIKRYNIKNLRHGLSRAWRRSRAAVSWSNAHLLAASGIATATPLALIERRWGPLRRQAYFLTEYAEGPEIAEVFADANVPSARKHEIAAEVAGLLHRLCLLRIEHGDFKASNLKIVGGRPLLLDLDAMRQHRCDWWFRRRHARDLRRFLKNWHNAPEISALLQSALKQAYGDDPVLALAGVDGSIETLASTHSK